MYPQGANLLGQIQNAVTNNVSAQVTKFDPNQKERSLKEQELKDKLKELEDQK